MSKVDVLVDMQFGSTGKGMLAGFLSRSRNYDMVISVNQPNAGHTAYCPDTDQKFVHKVLPSGIFGQRTKTVGIGAGAAFSIDQLIKEWKDVCEFRKGLTLVIHEAAAIVQPFHKDREAMSLSHISSTMQGSAEAVIDKMRRNGAAIVRHWEREIRAALKGVGDVMIVTQAQWVLLVNSAGRVLVEGSQGYSLGISAGFYPYCTSRDCTPARVLADAGIPLRSLRHIYATARVHPIRVGNTHDGYSGEWYPDQKELTFEELRQVPELTTVTGRVRRIATFSAIQIHEAMAAIQPDYVFLNFYQYDQEEGEKALRIIDDAAIALGCGGVAFLGTGPKPSDMVGVRPC